MQDMTRREATALARRTFGREAMTVINPDALTPKQAERAREKIAGLEQDATAFQQQGNAVTAAECTQRATYLRRVLAVHRYVILRRPNGAALATPLGSGPTWDTAFDDALSQDSARKNGAATVPAATTPTGEG